MKIDNEIEFDLDIDHDIEMEFDHNIELDIEIEFDIKFDYDIELDTECHIEIELDIEFEKLKILLLYLSIVYHVADFNKYYKHVLHYKLVYTAEGIQLCYEKKQNITAI